jgi:hypothetical protein
MIMVIMKMLIMINYINKKSILGVEPMTSNTIEDGYDRFQIMNTPVDDGGNKKR